MDRLFPGERVWRFEYEAEESLFELESGERVVADAVGPGLFHIHRFNGTALADGKLVESNTGSFSESFRAFTHQAESSKIELHLGRCTPINPVFWKVPKHVHEFAGWMLAPEGWTLLEPVYTYDSLDQANPVGAPGLHQCLTAQAFFLRNDEDRELAGWQSSDEMVFDQVEDFPAPFLDQRGEASFEIEIPSENEGVQIARFLDAGVGRQRAEIFVNKVSAGEWYYPFENREQRVQADLFGIPLALTRDQSRLHIRIVVPHDAPPWRTAWYGIDALLPRLQ